MKNGDRVVISGEVLYGDTYYRVASKGTIEEVGNTQSLVIVDMIDGDGNACVYVDNKYIFEN